MEYDRFVLTAVETLNAHDFSSALAGLRGRKTDISVLRSELSKIDYETAEALEDLTKQETAEYFSKRYGIIFN